jgi:CTP synthase (UTP-ammonia lyase)
VSAALRIGLIGDHSEGVLAHRAIALALQLAADAQARSVQVQWLPTEQLEAGLECDGLDGLWCVPGSPYRSLEGALRGIGYARARRVPFLGTCGGFQHTLIEYARGYLGWTDAEHAESSPQASRAVVTALECALVEVTAPVRLVAGTRIRAAYGCEHASEGYHCRFGLNPLYQDQLLAGPLRASAYDESGGVRAVELDEHPFFVATLFQPERAALTGRPAPLVRAFISACARPPRGA